MNEMIEFAQFLAPTVQLWKTSAPFPDREVLRLGVLKSLIRRIHGERSQMLALGDQKNAFQLQSLEEKVERLAYAPLIEDSLLKILATADAYEENKRPVPEQLYLFFDREKMNRFDRKWEREIAAQACLFGWEFWSLTATIDISQAEAFHFSLVDKLWPNGVVLFVEGTGEKSVVREDGVRLWKGHWHISVRPGTAVKKISLKGNVGLVDHEDLNWKYLFKPEML